MKLAILPEMQSKTNKQVNRGLYILNLLLVLLLATSFAMGLMMYRNIHHVQNTILTAADGNIIGAATIMVPGWVIIPTKVEHEAKLRLSTGLELTATTVRSQIINGIEVTLLRSEGIPAELLLNGTSLSNDERVYIQDNGEVWTGRITKQVDGLYLLSGDRQFPPGLAVTLASDHTALVGVTASTPTGPAIISVEQLQQSFAELK